MPSIISWSPDFTLMTTLSLPSSVVTVYFAARIFLYASSFLATSLSASIITSATLLSLCLP